MSAVTRPRGPLPRRVYWFRRLLVLAVAVGLVVGIARLLGTGGGEPAARATPVSGEGAVSGTPSATPSPGAAEDEPARSARREARQERRQERRKALPQPDGPCLDSDVMVTPLIRTQPAGQQVRVVLQVGTLESAACTWKVSPDRVFVNISDDDLGILWTTQHCLDAVPTADVVARKEKPARVAFVWGGRESDEECTGTGPWLTSGSYLVEAAARGSAHVEEAVFVLGPAVAPTITTSPTPTPEPDATGTPERPERPESGKQDRRDRDGA